MVDIDRVKIRDIIDGCSSYRSGNERVGWIVFDGVDVVVDRVMMMMVVCSSGC